MKVTDKALRALLRDCEIQGEWVDVGNSVYDESLVATVWGNLRAPRAELIALAPELAREVLALRREVRRLRKKP